MTISVFSLIKNEVSFIGFGIMSLLPYVDELVYGDGNSTDGTIELIEYIKSKYDPDNKIKLFKDFDFKDFKEDYVKKFNEIMSKCSGDYLWYCHPDMIVDSPGRLLDRETWKAKAFSVGMRSFAGENMELEIVKGRTPTWKTIMKNDFGLHYWGNYGDDHEDMYFKAITGDEHIVHKNMRFYPFRVEDSGIRLNHFCECKPMDRRKQKMETVIKTITGVTDELKIKDVVENHPRVTLDGKEKAFGVFEFKDRQDPLPVVFEKHREEFNLVLGK
jgi:hypothetical protein